MFLYPQHSPLFLNDITEKMYLTDLTKMGVMLLGLENIHIHNKALNRQ